MMGNLLGSMPKPAAGASADPVKDGMAWVGVALTRSEINDFGAHSSVPW